MRVSILGLFFPPLPRARAHTHTHTHIQKAISGVRAQSSGGGWNNLLSLLSASQDTGEDLFDACGDDEYADVGDDDGESSMVLKLDVAAELQLAGLQTASEVDGDGDGDGGAAAPKPNRMSTSFEA